MLFPHKCLSCWRQPNRTHALLEIRYSTCTPSMADTNSSVPHLPSIIKVRLHTHLPITQVDNGRQMSNITDANPICLASQEEPVIDLTFVLICVNLGYSFMQREPVVSDCYTATCSSWFNSVAVLRGSGPYCNSDSSVCILCCWHVNGKRCSSV